MPDALNSPMRTLTSTLIGVLGTTATLKRKEPGVVDPRTEIATGDTETTYTIPVSAPVGVRADEVTENVLRTDLKVEIPAKDLDTGALSVLDKPEVGKDFLTIDGSVFRLVAAVPNYAGKDPVSFNCYLRK